MNKPSQRIIFTSVSENSASIRFFHSKTIFFNKERNLFLLKSNRKNPNYFLHRISLYSRRVLRHREFLLHSPGEYFLKIIIHFL